MSDHSFLPPSGAHSWVKCAAWPKMNERFPQTEGDETLEGTAAHWVAWKILAMLRKPEETSIIPVPGTAAPNGAIVTDEMMEGGELLFDVIRQRMLNQLMELHIEERIAIPHIANSNFGTPDVWGVTITHDAIELIDYKFGHRFVDEYWNPQGLCYLLGILNKLCRDWETPWKTLLDRFVVNFTVVQPRCFYRGAPVRTHSFKAIEAVPHFEKLIAAATAALVHQPTATTNPGCADCGGRHACSALQLAAYSDAEYADARVPVELTPAAAALELRFLQRALDRLEARVEGLKEITLSNIRSGKPVPYFRVEQGYGRQQWNIPEGQVIAVGQMFGKDLAKPGVITPNRAKKLGIPEALVQAYTVTPQTSLKLIPENPADAAKVFGK